MARTKTPVLATVRYTLFIGDLGEVGGAVDGRDDTVIVLDQGNLYINVNMTSINKYRTPANIFAFKTLYGGSSVFTYI